VTLVALALCDVGKSTKRYLFEIEGFLLAALRFCRVLCIKCSEDLDKRILKSAVNDFNNHNIAMLSFQTIVTYFLYFVSFVSAADTNAWKSRSIYFVLTDRIARSSSDTGGNACGNLGNYCGGTFKGLESKLDYIKGLGFDAIWITPVVASEYLLGQ
jgi:hypothetical protein